MERTERAEQMRRLLERREREKLTYRETAALEPGVTINQLFWWRRRLMDGASPPASQETPANPFVELVEVRDRAVAPLEILLAGGRRILVNADVDERMLVRVVRALEQC